MAQSGSVTMASVRPDLPSQTMSSMTGAWQAFGGGGVALPSLVNVTCISKQYQVSGHQVLVSLPETGMVNAMGHYQMPLDLQGHSGCLVV